MASTTACDLSLRSRPTFQSFSSASPRCRVFGDADTGTVTVQVLSGTVMTTPVDNADTLGGWSTLTAGQSFTVAGDEVSDVLAHDGPAAVQFVYEAA